MDKNSTHLWNFHRLRKPWEGIRLKKETISCLQNLSAYRAPKLRGHLPRSRRAAVLVALFVGREGDLYVILSRRSDKLRTYPGDTSLPGGKTEAFDHSLENAARREAFEEIGLPLDKGKIPLLCLLEPFLSSNHILVTPIVVVVLDKSLRPFLNAREVCSIFSHPLYGFLTASPVREPEPLENSGQPSSADYFQSVLMKDSQDLPEFVQNPPKPYHTFRDIPWHNRPVRIHSFLTGRESQGVKPISGLTAAILVRVAQIGYCRDPDFELYAPGQLSLEDRIAMALSKDDILRKACETERVDMVPWNKEIQTGRRLAKGML